MSDFLDLSTMRQCHARNTELLEMRTSENTQAMIHNLSSAVYSLAIQLDTALSAMREEVRRSRTEGPA